MPDIEKDLNEVGDDPILDFFSFVKAWHKTSTDNGDVIDQFMSMRTLLEVGEAIHLYAQWKELKCRESRN